MSWNSVCKKDDLISGTGLCALHNGEQVAIFYLGSTDQVFAVSNFDPKGEANVMSRGLLGSAGEEIFVASPLYKERYNLETGTCLDSEELSLKTYDIRIEAGEVQLAA